MYIKCLQRLLTAASLLTAIGGAAIAQEIVLEGIVVTSTKTAESAIDALSGSSAIGKEQLDQQFQADRAAEILRTIPGVTTSETATDTAQAVNVRGLQDFGRVNVLIDGARQNFQRSGHNANGVFYIEPEMLKSVDVTRGPSATIYGSGAIGGVVAFQLLDADDILLPGEQAAVRNRTRYSSNANGWLESGTGAIRAGNFDILGQANGRWSDDYEDGDGVEVPNTADTTKSYLIKPRWHDGGHEITGTFLQYDSDFNDLFGTAERGTIVDNTQYILGYTFQRPDTPLVDFSAKIYRNETRLDQERLDSTNPFEPAGSERSFQVDTEGFDVFNTSRFDFANVRQSLTYGGDAFRDEVTNDDPTGNGDELTPSGEREVSGAFIESQTSLYDTVDIVAALRYDTYKIDGGTTHLEGDHVSPKITGALTPLRGVTVFATYAEGYRAPAVTETLIQGVHPQPAPFNLRPNPELEPEVAHNIEGGVNLKFDGIAKPDDAFRAKAVVFRNKVDDFIDQVAVFDPTSPLFFALQYQNVAEATLEGVEVEAVYDAGAWFVGVGASRIRGTNEETKEGLYSIPADQITVTAGFRAFGDHLVAGTRTRFVDAQTRIPLQTLTVFEPSEAYTVVDLFAYYELTDQFQLTANVDNVLDETYRQYLNRSNDPGFNARVGLTMRLGAP